MAKGKGITMGQLHKALSKALAEGPEGVSRYPVICWLYRGHDSTAVNLKMVTDKTTHSPMFGKAFHLGEAS